MPSKRESTQLPQASGKRPRATTSTSRALSSLTASSSSSSSSAIPPRDWENLVHNHFPSSYHITKKTNDSWKNYYLRTLNDTAKAIDTPEEGQRIKDIFTSIFSLENMDVCAHALNEADKEIFLMQIIRALNNLPHSTLPRRLINLTALIHHRLPQDLASELFIKAVAGYKENEDLIKTQNQALVDAQNPIIMRIRYPFLIEEQNQIREQIRVLREQSPLTPVYWALICRQPITTKIITQSPGDYRLQQKSLSILHLATCLNDLKFIKSLAIHGLQIDRYGCNNLIVAINYGFYDIVNFFLTLPNILLDIEKNPLDIALLKGNMEIVELLLDQGNIKNVGKITLLRAAKLGNTDIIKKILACDASASIEALEEAIREEDSVAIDTLFEGGVHVEPDSESELITQELAIRAQMNSEILKNCTPLVECLDEDTIIAFLKGKGPGLYSMPIGYTPDGIYFFEEALGGSVKAIHFLITSDVKTPMVLKPFFQDTEDRLPHRLLALTIVSERLSRAGLPIVLKEEEKVDLCQGKPDFLDRIKNEYPTDLLQNWLKELVKAPETACCHTTCQKLIEQLEQFELTELLKELELLDALSFENAETNSLPSISQQSGYGPERFFKLGMDKSSAEENVISSSNSSSPCSSSSSSSCSSTSEDWNHLRHG